MLLDLCKNFNTIYAAVTQVVLRNDIDVLGLVVLKLLCKCQVMTSLSTLNIHFPLSQCVFLF